MSVFEKWYTYTKPILKNKTMSMDDIILVFTEVEGEGSSFNWVSNKLGIRAIVIETGDVYYRYTYSNNETSGSKVSSIGIDPVTNKPYKITQVQVLCKGEKNYNIIFGLVVPSLTCSSSYVRNWSWLAEHIGPSTITKEVYYEDGTFTTINNKIKYTPSFIDSKWIVTGNIVIHNNSPENITVNDIDIDSDGSPSSVSILNLLLPIIVYPASSISWTYKITYSNFVSNGLVKLTSYISNQNSVNEFPAQHSISKNETVCEFTMNEPTEEYGRIGSTLTLQIDGINGIYIHDYNADIPVNSCGNITYTINNDISWNIINSNTYSVSRIKTTIILKVIECVISNCTFTTEYWKTHNKYSPRDNRVWGQYVNEDDMFFRTGRTWYQTLMLNINTATAYQKLSVEYIAARLNSYKGANTNVIFTELSLTTLYFNGRYSMNTSTANTYYNKLKSYNSGTIGPGSCIY